MIKIGCHLSVSKGYLAMAKTAVSINADTFQFFTRNPRGGNAKAINEEDISRFKAFAAEKGIEKVLAHAPYTLNACSPDEKVREFAFTAMTEDLARMEYIPGQLYNFHPGSHVGQGKERGIELIAELLNKVLYPEMTTTVLLETMAGKGSEIGSEFEELRAIIDRTELSEKLGVCLDTCHVYDAGYDIVNDLETVLDKFDRIVGLDRLKAVHINDSKNPMGSHKDRHERIGEGYIGIKAFERIINEPHLNRLLFYLETPNELEGYAKEIDLLHNLSR